MRRDVGDPHFPIWLLGDSNPERWQDVLDTPLDPRHPARHNIWTPVLDEIQDKVFRNRRCRLDTSRLYIRNALGDPSGKLSASGVEWGEPAKGCVAEFSDLIVRYAPPVLLCFGAFAFEFARRALGEKPERAYSQWGARNLGVEFRRRIQNFGVHVTNAFPLLHVSIARGNFVESHDYFCDQRGANYFAHVGHALAGVFMQHRNTLRIWIT